MWKYILKLFGIKRVRIVSYNDGYPTSNTFIQEYDKLYINNTFNSKLYTEINVRAYNVISFEHNGVTHYYVRPKDYYKNGLEKQAMRFEDEFYIYYVF